jgi:hypothetical protein
MVEPPVKLTAVECMNRLRDRVDRTGSEVHRAEICVGRDTIAFGITLRFRGRVMDMTSYRPELRVPHAQLGRRNTGSSVFCSLHFGHGSNPALIDGAYTDTDEFLDDVAGRAATMLEEEEKFLKEYAAHALKQNQQHQEFLTIPKAATCQLNRTTWTYSGHGTSC